MILYALLEGEVPFRGPTALAVLRQHEAAPVPPPAHAPPAVLPVLRRCLAKDPARRYQTPSELVAALEAAARALAAGAPAATGPAAPARPGGRQTREAPGRGRGRRRRGRGRPTPSPACRWP